MDDNNNEDETSKEQNIITINEVISENTEDLTTEKNGDLQAAIKNDDNDNTEEMVDEPTTESTTQTTMRRSTRVRRAPDRSYNDVLFLESIERKNKLAASRKKRNNTEKSTTKTTTATTTPTKKKKTSPASTSSTSSSQPQPQSIPEPDPGPPGGVWTTLHSPYISLEIRRPTPPPYHSYTPHDHLMDNIKLNTGVITHWCPPLDRTPALFHVSFEHYTEDLVLEEIELALGSHKKRAGNSLSQSQYQIELDKINLYHKNRQRQSEKALRSKCSTYLPTLTIIACKELEKQKPTKTSSSTPSYYRYPPAGGSSLSSALSRSAGAGAGGAPFDDDDGISFQHIWQRVKSGCSLANDYYIRKSRYMSGDKVRTSTRRAAAAAENGPLPFELPSEYEPGGRVARCLLHLLDENDDNGDSETIPTPSDRGGGFYERYDDTPPSVDIYRQQSLSLSPSYFSPPKSKILSHLGKTTGITGSDIQHAILHNLQTHNAVQDMMLRCMSRYSINDLSLLDVSQFHKIKFAIAMTTGEKETMVESQEELDRRREEELKKRQFEVWRYRGIQEGCTICFGSWYERAKVLLRDMMETTGGATAVVEPVTSSTEPSTSTTADDEALALSLSSRRSKRSSQSQSEPIFYGNASSLTHVQLCESIFRLITAAAPNGMSLLDLQRVIEDMNLRRMKTGLMRLLYKEGKIRRLAVDLDLNAEMAPVVAADSKEGKSEEANETTPVKSEPTETPNPALSHLVRYMSQLKRTEALLRSLLTAKLQTPYSKIAKAADDDAANDVDVVFPDDNDEDAWLKDHTMVGKRLLRPDGNDDWRVVSYHPSLMEEGDDAAPGVIKRGRFEIEREGGMSADITEGQLRAGMEALTIVRNNKRVEGRRLERYLGERLTILLGEEDGDEAVDGVVAGYGDDENGVAFLILVDEREHDDDDESLNEEQPCPGSSFWTIYKNDTIMYKEKPYRVSFHSPYLSATPLASSVISTLKAHPRCQPFLEPVDPVALGIPDYFTIITHPMAVSTLEKNLHAGKYDDIDDFKKDVILMFDNAIKYNGDGSWISNSAKILKKLSLRKLQSDTLPTLKEPKKTNKKGAYEDDSDFSFEEDVDDDHPPTNKRRNRRGGDGSPSSSYSSSFDANAPIEHSIKIPPSTTTNTNLLPSVNLPLNTNPSTFSLPKTYTCRHTPPPPPSSKKNNEQPNPEDEKAILLALAQNSRRSSRSATKAVQELESSMRVNLQNVTYVSEDGHKATHRAGIERFCEEEHERFAKLYYDHSSSTEHASSFSLLTNHYSKNSFPPYLGHVSNFIWEIHSDYLIPALRWVIRGMLQTGHLGEAPDGGIVVQNLYTSEGVTPMDMLKIKATGKHQKESEESSESEEEKEMSEYERKRAERVARNQERLKALGLG